MKRFVTGLAVFGFTLAPAVMPARGQFNFGGIGEKTKTIAVFEIEGQLLEKPQEMSFSLGGKQPTSLKDLIERFKKAREDANVKAVVVTFSDAGMGIGQLEELRKAIAQTKAAGKDIVVRLEEAQMGLYALATGASRISMAPTGDLWLTGLYGEAPYLKGMLDKIHVEADFEHMGAYKSAAEPLTRTEPSKEAEEMTNWLLDSLYDSLVGMIAEGRSIKADKVKALIDDGPYSAERAKEVGLIDAVEHHDELVAYLKKRYGEDATIAKNYGEKKELELPGTDPFSLLSFFTKMFKGGEEHEAGNAVGIVYVDGPIVTGESPQGLFGGETSAGSTSIRRALEKAANDDGIKALVLRVDSPGGSALASEIIWKATQEVAKKKPFIVSMGNVAGSGGYYVSCGAQSIFADDTTITASIGVIGGKLVTSGLWNWAGVNWVAHQRGKNADLLSTSKKWDEQQRQRIRKWMEDVYGVFKQRVVAGRGKKLAKPIDEMAGGRVYTGKQALDLGLVDKIGGLDEAVKYAAAQANLSDYEVRVVPKPKNLIEMVIDSLTGHQDDEGQFSLSSSTHALLKADAPLLQSALPLLEQLDPQRTRAVWRTLMRLELIRREGVITMMPEELIIR
ncbi:MAG TPA: signal peptide peptidase SppA [Phycisphaerae bacterium]